MGVFLSFNAEAVKKNSASPTEQMAGSPAAVTHDTERARGHRWGFPQGQRLAKLQTVNHGLGATETPASLPSSPAELALPVLSILGTHRGKCPCTWRPPACHAHGVPVRTRVSKAVTVSLARVGGPCPFDGGIGHRNLEGQGGSLCPLHSSVPEVSGKKRQPESPRPSCAQAFPPFVHPKSPRLRGALLALSARRAMATVRGVDTTCGTAGRNGVCP